MDSFFSAVGILTTTVFALAIGWLIWEIIGNIYGGILGAYRMRHILHKDGVPRIGHWSTIKMGLHCWTGRRYRDGIGEYWTIGNMEVPLDGRDPIKGRP